MYNSLKNCLAYIKNNIQSRSIIRESFDSIRRAADVTVRDRFVHLSLKNIRTEDLSYKFPLIWLRDNCQCPECFHADSQSRVIKNWENFKFDVSLKSAVFDKSLKIIWNDDHVSEYNFKWLRDRSFADNDRRKYLSTTYRPDPRLWGKADFENVIESFEFEDVVNTSDGLRTWLLSLAKNGCAFINNAPATENECRRIADLVGFIKKTHYGEEFIVKAKEGTNNVAYLSAPLQMHSDLPYYEYKPGVNLLHCLVQSNSPGAFNLLSDGFFVAQRLKREHPEFYQVLTTTLVNWSDYGNEDGFSFQKIYRAPVISLDYEGKLNRINHSVPQRDSFFSIPLEQVDRWYEAMIQFVKMLNEEAVSFKTKPGDILTFSNIRLSHGRTGYTDVDGNARHLVGAYIDWDEIYSRLRVLSQEVHV